MKENQYQDLIDVDRDVGRTSFGLMSNQVWHDDPKRLVFILARYKFVARLLEGRATGGRCCSGIWSLQGDRQMHALA